ncbi:MAG: GcrA family cell cycle regulator [Hyphomicrobiales bacterium]
MSWTQERVELLTKLWTEGLSASQIALRMGGVTRNAVIGKVHRIGLSGRARPSRPSQPRNPRPRTSQPSQPANFPVAGNTALKPQAAPATDVEIEPEIATAPAPIREVTIPPGERVTMMTLTERTCKWPIGDPSKDDFYFCGHRSQPAMPYCLEHAKLAYQPSQERRRTKKKAVGNG